jgi:hypothetical protein
MSFHKILDLAQFHLTRYSQYPTLLYLHAHQSKVDRQASSIYPIHAFKGSPFLAVDYHSLWSSFPLRFARGSNNS